MLSLRSALRLVKAGGVRLNPSASIMWPAKFEDPLKNREEIRQIQKTPEYERKVNVPVKSALSDASCSMFLVGISCNFTSYKAPHSCSGSTSSEICQDSYRAQQWTARRKDMA